jgi:dUTP pyrophosphatase
MRRIAAFEKVSPEQYDRDLEKTNPEFSEAQRKEIYASVQLPLRATSGSAGYDFYAPFDITISPGAQVLVPTGIRVRMDEEYVLMLFPRSSLGFRYRLQLNNTVGIIDSDYYHADNEGHIFCKLTNDSKEGKTVVIERGQGMIQGIFLPFGITEDDAAEGKRTGGFGSTTQKAGNL